MAAAALASAGHDVLGIDIDADKIRAFRAGRSPIYEPGLAELIEDGLAAGNLRFMTCEEVAESLGSVVIIATGTPPMGNGTADLSQVKESILWVLGKQPEGCTIVVKSTVPPGTGERIIQSMQPNGAPFTYVSNPEFLREGYAVHDWLHPDRIVIGGPAESLGTMKAVYVGIDAPYVVTDLTSAEMIKYTANAFLATKISFINEIAVLCDRLGATIDDVCEGISLDPRIGSSFLRAGVGYGGSCFPKDVRALDQVALTNDHNFELLRSVINVNNRQRHLPMYALRDLFGQLSGVKVSILGLAFKPETDDVREAPSLDVARMLVEEGADVRVFDPRAIHSARKVLPQTIAFCSDLMDCVAGAQALVLITEWNEIVRADWKQISGIMEHPRFVFDGRNALNTKEMQKLGFDYLGVGRASLRTAGSQSSHSVFPRSSQRQ